jgi:hypothetical protein
LSGSNPQVLTNVRAVWDARFLRGAKLDAVSARVRYSSNVYQARKTGYPFSTMATRDELKALIDQLPEPQLETVRNMLEHQVHPPPPRPEIERMQQRSREYKKRVEQRFR